MTTDNIVRRRPFSSNNVADAVPDSSQKKQKTTELELFIKPDIDQVTMSFQLTSRVWSINSKYTKQLKELIEKTQSSCSKGLFLPFQSKQTHVYKIANSESPSQVLSYLKERFEKPSEAAFLEALMWNISQIFGWDDYFVPTTEAHLFFNNTIHSGSLQPAIVGLHISELQSRNASFLIPFESILKITFMATVIGAYDWHGHNAICDENGDIFLFDNIRSLAHSNYLLSIIHGEKDPFPPLKVFSIALPESWEMLKPEHKAALSEWAETVKTRMGTFHELLTTYAKDRLASMSKHCFNIQQVLAAFQERIEAILIALKEDKIQCIVDIPFCVSQGYKIAMGFYLAASHATRLAENPAVSIDVCLLEELSDFGHESLQHDFDTLQRYSISLGRLVDLCKQPVHSIDSLKEIYQYVEFCIQNPPSNKVDVQEANKVLYDQLEERAVPDYKDSNEQVYPSPYVIEIPKCEQPNLNPSKKKLAEVTEELAVFMKIKNLYLHRLANLSQQAAESVSPVLGSIKKMRGLLPPQDEANQLKQKFKPIEDQIAYLQSMQINLHTLQNAAQKIVTD